MIPLRDHNLRYTTPHVTNTLIGANIVFFIISLFIGDFLTLNFALIPGLFSPLNLISSQFLHASFGHIIGNMLFLHIFGDNLEDYFGHIKFLIFYIFSGIFAGLAQYFVSPSSLIPIVGASGAIAGLMGAYLVLFPKSKIDVLIPFGFLASEATVSAPFMLLYWIGAQLFYSVGAIGQTGGGVAYFAHIGGFVFGFLIGKIFEKRVEIIPPKVF